jgi:hypothetical protein
MDTSETTSDRSGSRFTAGHSRFGPKNRYAKRDGSAMGAGQINLRTRAGGSYEHLFERDGKLLRIRGDKAAPSTANDQRVPAPDADVREVVESALTALAAPRHALANAEAVVPHLPGLYAIYGGAAEWAELGLGHPPDDRPLYVGKSESNLADRDLRTHFGNGRTRILHRAPHLRRAAPRCPGPAWEAAQSGPS